MTHKVFVVVPAYNEASALGEVLDDLSTSCPSAQVVVIDDGSSDETGDVAIAHRVHALSHVVNLGQGAALATGVRYAVERGADVVVTYDADGQMLASDIERVVAPVTSGRAEVVFGSRFAGIDPDGMGLGRRILLRSARLFGRVTGALPLSDAHCGFRALSRKAAASIEITQARMAHASEIVSEVKRLGLPWIEVPVSIRYTAYSKSKGQSPLGATDILADLFWGRRR